MKKLVLLCVFSFLFVGSILAVEKTKPVFPAKNVEKMDFRLPKTLATDQTRINSVSQGEFEGGIIFWEDFEPGGLWHRWEAVDLTHPRPQHGPSYWHVTTWEAMDSTCWWLADTTLGDVGGYANHWYQVLDTPPIMVTDTNAYLSFYQRFKLEGTAGAQAPYDGWDGINVRISLDSGKTWQVLPFDNYDMQNSWAFGHPAQGQNEGLGIPAWSGTQLEWRKEMIDLSDFVKSDSIIMIRFAFAADMGYSTADPGDDDSGLSLFGWQIDSILVASEDSIFFFNNGEKDSMVGRDIEFIPPEGGNLWHIAEMMDTLDSYLPDFAPSPTHIAVCQNSGNVFDPLASYNPWMDNVFRTGPIALPDTTPIYLDFTHLPFFADEDLFPNNDFWRVDVRPVGDSTDWEAVWIGSEGQQWVFAEGFDNWVAFSFFWGYPTNMSPLDLSRFAGQDVYLRWHFWSDEDEPIGMGLLFDNVVVYSPVKTIEPPTGVEIFAGQRDTTITITWNREEGKVYQIWRTTPGDQYLHLKGEVADTNVFVDTDIEPFQYYYYTMRAVVKYEGTSDFSTPLVGTEVVPITIWELAYDLSSPDTVIVAPRNKLVYVKFTPIAYPMDLKGVKIALDTTGTNVVGAAQFTVWDDDGTDSLPGTKLKYFNKSGLGFGFNRIILDDSIAIDSGSFYIGFKRFGNGPKLFAESD